MISEWFLNQFLNGLTAFPWLDDDGEKVSLANTYKLARVCENDQHNRNQTSCVIFDFIP